VPLWAGWRWQRNGWFLEGRGGVAVTMPLSYRGDIRQVREFRNRVRIRERSSIENPEGLVSVFPEWQAGLRIGLDLWQGWQIQAGFDFWRSFTSVIDHPEYRSILQGQGLSFGFSRQIGKGQGQ
jgi:hypothetical protein